jgi:two-component system, response regulator, stage 0 sporulation protein F
MDATAQRLLVLDDDDAMRKMFAQYFTMRGFCVDMAASVPEALQRLSADCRVVLCDVRMPGLNGIDFLREVHERRPDVGVFLITGFPDLDTLIEARQLGAAGYFRKPIDLRHVASRLQLYLAEGLNEGGWEGLSGESRRQAAPPPLYGAA